jgi:cytochrome c oxidase subunit 2
MIKKVIFIPVLLTVLMTAAAALADTPVTNWIQHPATPLAHEVRHNFWIMFGLTMPFLLLPQILLAIAIVKFRGSKGHEPAKFHENIGLEIAWTVIPILTLIMISIPAFSNLKKIDVPPKSDLVVEVIGHQFFWEYRYPRYGIAFSSEPLVVPASKVVTLNLTSVDVIHSYWVPAFGIKQDANPGRITHTWFNADEGKYKGQCAELCGALHAEMYIDVTVLPEEEFMAWVKERMIPVEEETSEPEDSLNHAERNVREERGAARG